MTGFTVPRYPAGQAARMAGLAGVDAARVRHWLFGRSVQESVGSPLLRQVAPHACARMTRAAARRGGPAGQAGGALRAGTRRGHHPGTARR
jgi:hypothetical protein